jgi:hypothetical protein|tara:strand:+ start:117 stop:485 length:369 start_codon:yes stop_codon:yes gene_type:complete
MIKLVVLKSGEDLICDVEEMVVAEKVVGYYLINPCVASISQDKRMRITPWKPLSSDISIPVITDHVLTIITPQDALMNLYVQTLEKYENRKFKSGPTSEQPEVGDTDRGSDSGSGRARLQAD